MTTRHALVIEDNLDLAEIYRLTLDMVCYTCEIISDGKQALIRLEGERPNVIILDMNLPQVSGHYIYKKIRANPDWNTMPIIISTANTIVANALSHEITAMDRLVVKPISPRQLKEILLELEEAHTKANAAPVAESVPAKSESPSEMPANTADKPTTQAMPTRDSIEAKAEASTLQPEAVSTSERQNLEQSKNPEDSMSNH